MAGRRVETTYVEQERFFPKIHSDKALMQSQADEKGRWGIFAIRLQQYRGDP